MARKKLESHWQIFIALILALAVGYGVSKGFVADSGEGLNPTGQSIVGVLGFIGDLFLRALNMIIVPLIFSSIVSGIAGLGEMKGYGRLGSKTLLYYISTSAISIIVGLTLVNTIKPGLVDGEPNPKVAELIDSRRAELEENAKDKTEASSAKGLAVVGEIFQRMIPKNPFAAASDNGQMLALIFISLLVAFSLIKLEGTYRDTLLHAVMGVNQLMLLVTGWIMLFAPIGVFGLVSAVIAESGFAIVGAMLKFFFTVLLGLGIHFLLVLPLILKFVGRVNPLRHYMAMGEALLTAFSTASSSATLPVTLRCLQRNAGVSKRTASFVLPLGATVNMDGTALYECVAVLFIAQVLGVPLDVGQQFLVVVLALMTSIGVAGVPSASLVAIVIIVNNVGIEGAGAAVGAIFAVDRLLDMCRTAINIFSDSCGAVVIAKSEGESKVLAG